MATEPYPSTTEESTTSNNTAVRVIFTENNDPWFVAKDVCDVLGLSNTSVAMQYLDHDEVSKYFLNTQHGEIYIISETGMYKLIMRSRKESAKPFQRWVTREILSSIRKNNEYTFKSRKNEDGHMSADFLIKLPITTYTILPLRIPSSSHSTPQKTTSTSFNMSWTNTPRNTNK